MLICATDGYSSFLVSHPNILANSALMGGGTMFFNNTDATVTTTLTVRLLAYRMPSTSISPIWRVDVGMLVLRGWADVWR